VSTKDLNRNLNGLRPLSYMGVNPSTPPQLVTETRAPTANDYIRFAIGTLWLIPPTNNVYILTSKANNIATWTKLTTLGGVFEFTTDVGGPVYANPSNAVAVVGGTNVVTNGATPNTIIINGSGGGVTWSTETTSMPAAIDHGYIVNGAGTVVFTLPAVCPAGSVFKFTGINNATGWQVLANAGQTIYFGAVSTSVGGTLTSTETRNSIEIVCVVANTGFNVLNCQGNISIS
jgi:hypothetical protein